MKRAILATLSGIAATAHSNEIFISSPSLRIVAT